jgi:hypothetical protein
MASRMALGAVVSTHESRKRRGENEPHGLDGVGEDDLLVRVTLLVVVATVVDELHLLEHRRLRVLYERAPCASRAQKRTLPDSPAPRRSILISFFASVRSRLSWFSISSLPGARRVRRAQESRPQRGYARALASSSTTDDCVQPIACDGRGRWAEGWAEGNQAERYNKEGGDDDGATGAQSRGRARGRPERVRHTEEASGGAGRTARRLQRSAGALGPKRDVERRLGRRRTVTRQAPDRRRASVCGRELVAGVRRERV